MKDGIHKHTIDNYKTCKYGTANVYYKHEGISKRVL